MAHVAESKKKIVNEFTELVSSYPVVGVVNMENLPTAQLQKMRKQLRDKVLIKMTKRRLINIILDNTKEKKKDIEEMKNYLTGMPALLFTKDDPFILAKTLKKSMSTAPAKPGQVTPKDIIVTAGPTPFSPGPVISELASAGIKTAIENGKIVVKSDAVVVKKGEKVSQDIAGILTRLGVEPMEVGLNLTAVYDNGTIFTKDVLDIDEEEFMGKIKTAHNSAIGLALELSFLTKETTEMMISKAFREAKAIALSQNIMADGVKEDIMAKVNREMLALKSKLNIPDVPKEKPKEEEKEEIKKEAEEKPEEKKKEVKEAEKSEEIKESEEKPEEKKSEDKKEEVKEEVKKDEQKVEIKAEEAKEKTQAEKPEEKAKNDDTKGKPEEEKKEVKNEVIEKVEEIKEVKETPKEEKVPVVELADKVEKKEEIKEPEEKPKEEKSEDKKEEVKEEVKKDEQKVEIKAEKPEEQVQTKENQDKQN